MPMEIVNRLRLQDLIRDTFIFITKDSTSDINFVFREILLHYIRNDYSVILLNLSQSSAHYSHLLLKSGVNQRQLRENQRFFIIDGMSEIEKLADSTSSDTEGNEVFSALFSDCEDAERTKKLYLHIKTVIESSVANSKPFVLLIDDVNILLNLGFSLNAINVFVNNCRSLCRLQVNARNILLIGSTYETRDACNCWMNNYLLHLTDISIQVKGLNTGYSKDAHGKVFMP